MARFPSVPAGDAASPAAVILTLGSKLTTGVAPPLPKSIASCSVPCSVWPDAVCQVEVIVTPNHATAVSLTT